jgi:hypothetical protein
LLAFLGHIVYKCTGTSITNNQLKRVAEKDGANDATKDLV